MPLIIIAHNIRSTHNVGAILRSCDGFGVAKFYATGYTPYPQQTADERPPHIRHKMTQQIHKTALGAEQTVPHEQVDDPLLVIKNYKAKGFTIAALEQHTQATPLPGYHAPNKLVLLLGEEVHGTPAELLQACDAILEIPMKGTKESFNVSVAAGIALYALSFQ